MAYHVAFSILGLEGRGNIVDRANGIVALEPVVDRMTWPRLAVEGGVGDGITNNSVVGHLNVGTAVAHLLDAGHLLVDEDFAQQGHDVARVGGRVGNAACVLHALGIGPGEGDGLGLGKRQDLHVGIGSLGPGRHLQWGCRSQSLC